VKYIGVGGAGEMSLRNSESAKRVLDSTFLVQEYVEGGNLRNQVLEQVTPSSGLRAYRALCMEQRVCMKHRVHMCSSSDLGGSNCSDTSMFLSLSVKSPSIWPSSRVIDKHHLALMIAAALGTARRSVSWFLAYRVAIM
jgi:hypothetical protein